MFNELPREKYKQVFQATSVLDLELKLHNALQELERTTLLLEECNKNCEILSQQLEESQTQRRLETEASAENERHLREEISRLERAHEFFSNVSISLKDELENEKYLHNKLEIYFDSLVKHDCLRQMQELLEQIKVKHNQHIASLEESHAYQLLELHEDFDEVRREYERNAEVLLKAKEEQLQDLRVQLENKFIPCNCQSQTNDKSLSDNDQNQEVVLKVEPQLESHFDVILSPRESDESFNGGDYTSEFMEAIINHRDEISRENQQLRDENSSLRNQLKFLTDLMRTFQSGISLWSNTQDVSVSCRE